MTLNRTIVVLFILFLADSADLYPQASNEFIFLFDNSGSMSGYYREQNSAFKIFSKVLIRNSVKENDAASVYLFTRNDPARGISSPKKLYEGAGKDLIADQVIKNFTLMRGKDGEFGTTDLIQALDKGVESIRGNTGIIWLITDNINDNSGSGDSSYINTLEFYKRLRSDDNIRKILLYPIFEKVSEAGYVSNGYVVYGIVYSRKPLTQENLEYYDGIVRGAGIRQKAITLKPLDIGTIVLVPQVSQGRISPAKLFYDGKKLRGFDFEEGEKIRETFSGLSLKSNLYPHIIRSARLDVKLENFVSSDYSVKSIGTQKISPETVSNVSPEGEVKGFTVMFDMPEITPRFSLNTIFKEDFTVGGNLMLEVSSVDILLDENYVNSFRELFALQTVPEIFKPVLKDKKIITVIPLEIRIKYGPWRIFLLLGIVILICAAITVLLYFLFRKKCITVVINKTDEQNYCLNSFSSADILIDYSIIIGKIKKSLSGKFIFTYSKNTATPGVKVLLADEVPVQTEYTEDGISSRSAVFYIKKTEIKHEVRDSGLSDFH